MAGNPFTAYSAAVTAVAWTNGAGQVTGATLQNLYGLENALIQTLGTWTTTGVYQPAIPNGYLTTAMFGTNVLSFANLAGTPTPAQLASFTAPAGTLTGATLASNVLSSSLTSTGTLTGGATGAGFTVNLGASILSGILPLANGGLGSNTAIGARSNLAAAASGANTDITSLGNLSAILDVAFGSTQGQLLARGASGWVGIASGTTGSVLTSNGIGVLPNYQSTSTLTFPDQPRRNLLLDQINMAKALATAQRGIGSFVDGFADTSGIVAGSSSGYSVNTGPKTLTNAGAASQMGVASSSNAESAGTFLSRSITLANGATLSQIGVYSTTAGTFDLKVAQRTGAGAYTIVQSQSVSHGGAGWQFFTLTSAYAVPATGTYVVGYYQAGITMNTTGASGLTAYLLGADATGSSTGYMESTSNNEPVMATTYAPSAATIVTTPQTADVTVSYNRAAIILAAGQTPTWGTTDTMEVTCNGGANWTAVVPVNAGVVQAGASQNGGVLWEAPDTFVTNSGTSFQLRYKVLGSTARTVYGLSSTVH